MKKNLSLVIIVVLISQISCSINRYALKNDSENEKFLIHLVKQYEKQELVGKKPIIVLDGIPYRYDYELKDSSFTFTKNDVETVEILKEQAANRIYGDFAKDGVILITTKTTEVPIKAKESTQDKSIIYFVDGKQVLDFDSIRNMDPKTISAIDIIKNPDSLKFYRSDYSMLEGVIKIKTNQFLIRNYRIVFSDYSPIYKILSDTIPLEKDLEVFSYWLCDSISLKDVKYWQLDSISRLKISEVQVIPILNEERKVYVNIKLANE